MKPSAREQLLADLMRLDRKVMDEKAAALEVGGEDDRSTANARQYARNRAARARYARDKAISLDDLKAAVATLDRTSNPNFPDCAE